jgi:aerobic-type carbon monoxide dehydrogenase small subunit (CoxS/CutS family)
MALLLGYMFTTGKGALMEKTITFIVNGKAKTVSTAPERKLLEVLREDLGLTGTKNGCGEGQCGACTVLVDGQTAHACLVPVADVEGAKIVTIEGLAQGDKLHPLQEAFLAESALQCGFCTPGMILGALGLLDQKPNPSEAEIAAGMEGHICRCGSYPRIVQAIKLAASQMKGQEQ